MAVRTPTIEELRAGPYVRLRQIPHRELIEFVADHFWRRPTWVTRVHHLMSLMTLAAIVIVGVRGDFSWRDILAQSVLTVPAMLLVVLPLHEALHAIGYRLVGARQIRWAISLRMLAAYVVAERFVAGRGAFFVVALVPFVLINPALIVAAFLMPGFAIFFLVLLLWHIGGSAGDWALLNFYWLNRQRPIFTFDDAENSYFYVGTPTAQIPRLRSE